jgi:hypothetical protein
MNWNEVTFGVEIECFAPRGNHADVFAAMRNALAAQGLEVSMPRANRHATTSGWKVVPDVSIVPARDHVGMELVSPILKGQDGIDQVLKVGAALAVMLAKVNQSCGLHVHCGSGGASVGQLRNLAKMFCLYEDHFDTLVPVSRRANNNRFTRSNKTVAGYNVPDIMSKLDAARTERTIVTIMNTGVDTRNHYNQFRYYKLNFQSRAMHGTVEYRQHSGSVDGVKIAAWVRLVTGFTASAFSASTVIGTDRTFDSLMRKVDRTTETFLRARRDALARTTTTGVTA